MRMTYFKYDVETLLGLVESKPCIWDKNCDEYKSRRLRAQSWNEIFSYLEVGYAELSREEKKHTGNMIIQKYTNVRDAFIKSLRSKGAKRRYIYAKNLQFLVKATKQKTNYHYSINSEPAEESTQQVQPTPSPIPPSTCEATSINRNTRVIKKPKTQKRRLDEIEKEILAEIKKPHLTSDAPHCCQSRKIDDKEIILLSFMPYIKDMDENEMMNLHMDVLSSIWKIKQKRVSGGRINQSQNFSPSRSYTAFSNSEGFGNQSGTAAYSCENDLNPITASMSSTHHKEEMENIL